MLRRFRRVSATLAVVALLVNLAGHVAQASSMASLELSGADGPILIICTPTGTKLLAWTPDGFVPLPDQPQQGKQSCSFCTAVSGGAVLPSLMLAEIERTATGEPIVQTRRDTLRPLSAFAKPLARAPPRTVTV
ncbi:MAG: DUF2946 family protein [Kiloniellales bacterium]